MGYNNPAFVDDDNKASNNTGTPIRLTEKHNATNIPTTNDVMHETSVNIVLCTGLILDKIDF